MGSRAGDVTRSKQLDRMSCLIDRPEKGIPGRSEICETKFRLQLPSQTGVWEGVGSATHPGGASHIFALNIRFNCG